LIQKSSQCFWARSWPGGGQGRSQALTVADRQTVAGRFGIHRRSGTGAACLCYLFFSLFATVCFLCSVCFLFVVKRAPGNFPRGRWQQTETGGGGSGRFCAESMPSSVASDNPHRRSNTSRHPLSDTAILHGVMKLPPTHPGPSRIVLLSRLNRPRGSE